MNFLQQVMSSVDLSERSQQEQECSICMSKRREIRMRPCGHASSCALCTLQLIDAPEQKLKCPICKATAKTLEWPGAPGPGGAKDVSIRSQLSSFDPSAAAEGNSMPIDEFLRRAADSSTASSSATRDLVALEARVKVAQRKCGVGHPGGTLSGVLL